jgi:hypothetical protein
MLRNGGKIVGQEKKRENWPRDKLIKHYAMNTWGECRYSSTILDFDTR